MLRAGVESSVQAERKQIAITENPFRIWGPARIPKDRDSESVVEHKIEYVRNTKGGKWPGIRNRQVEIEKIIRPGVHLRLKAHQGGIRNGRVEPLLPAFVAILPSYREKVRQQRRLIQVELRHPASISWTSAGRGLMRGWRQGFRIDPDEQAGRSGFVACHGRAVRDRKPGSLQRILPG